MKNCLFLLFAFMVSLCAAGCSSTGGGKSLENDADLIVNEVEKEAVCATGDKSCDDENKTILICSKSQTWTLGEACGENSECVNGACVLKNGADGDEDASEIAEEIVELPEPEELAAEYEPEIAEETAVEEEAEIIEETAAEEEGEKEAYPIDLLDNITLYVNIGDSVAAGYNAFNHNQPGGRGYSRLIYENNASWPLYDDYNVAALYPDAQYVDISKGGDTSDDMVDRVNQALIIGLPYSTAGDVLVTIYIGGNDFKADIQNMIMTYKTEAVAKKIQDNIKAVVQKLKDRYENKNAGKNIVFLIANLHEPTDGTGKIPSEYNQSFCKTINDPLMGAVRQTVMSNINLLNQRFAEVIAEVGGYLVDSRAVFLSHGMNAGNDRWIDTDCVHPIDIGHNGLRKQAWFVLTGQTY